MKAQLKMFNGTPTVFLDGQPAFFGCHKLGTMSDEDLRITTPVIREHAKAGIHIYSIDAKNDARCGPRPDVYDFSKVQSNLQTLIDADPQAVFLYLFQLETRGLPNDWWNKAYPDELELMSDGTAIAQSFASTVWREQCDDYLRAYIDHLRSIGLYDRVIAYQVGTGVTTEWVKSWSSMERTCGDYSQPMRRHFRAWLERHYKTVEALQAAWNNPKVTFESAEISTAEEQLNTQHLSLRDPRREQKTIDFYACYAELCADDLLDFCHTIKEATHGEKLTGAFYGYLMELAWNDDFFAPHGQADAANVSAIQRSGHLGLKKVLHSPDIDFFVSPYGYAFRGLGGDGLAMQPSESLRVHGKIYFMEEDTLMHNNFDPQGRMQVMENSVSVYQRLFAESLTHAQGVTWWESNYFVEKPQLVDERRRLIKRFEELGQWAVKLDRTPRSEVAVFLDDESYLYETAFNAIDLPLIWQQRVVNLNRFGAPHDVYLLDDLLEGSLPDYKLYIFLNPFHLNHRRREALKPILRRDGKVSLWLYAAGYINSDAPKTGLNPLTWKEETTVLHTDHMTDLTGFHFGRGDSPWSPMMHVTHFDHPITQAIPQDLFWNAAGAIGPLFHLEDPQATVLGDVIYSLGRCRPGLGVKTFNPEDPEKAWSSVYVATPNVPAPLLRGIARFAEVNLYNEEGDVLYATPDLLSVHTVSGGPRTFKLPRQVEVVYDLFSQKEIARGVCQFEVQLPPASTALFFTGEAWILES